jgi:hypothetical protein
MVMRARLSDEPIPTQPIKVTRNTFPGSGLVAMKPRSDNGSEDGKDANRKRDIATGFRTKDECQRPRARISHQRIFPQVHIQYYVNCPEGIKPKFEFVRLPYT